MSFLLSDARTFLQDRNNQDSSTEATRRYDRIAQKACAHLHTAGNFAFDLRRGRLVFAAVSNTGTVSVAVDGTAVTGVGTSFQTTDVGRFIRFQGEDLSYLISARGSTTGITIENYRGDAAVSGAAYEITTDRVALPTRFRAFEKPVINFNNGRLTPKDLGELQNYRMYTREVGEPYWYAVEFVTGANDTVPAAYMWVYPAPTSKRVADFMYYIQPDIPADAGDDFGVPADPVAESLILEFLEAFLLEDQRDYQKAQQKLAYAEAKARKAVGHFRPIKDMQQKRMWNSAEDAVDRGINLSPLAPGEPVYE